MINNASTHQVLIRIFNQKFIKCFSNHKPIHINPIFLNEKDSDVVTEMIVNRKCFQKSHNGKESFESTDEIKDQQEYDSDQPIVVPLDDLKEKEINSPKRQAMFERYWRISLSIFMISQNYHELPKRTVWANGNLFHKFKPYVYRDGRNLYQDKTSINMTLDDYKYLTSTCWDKKYQRLTIDMTGDQYTGRYRLGLNSLFVPNSTPF